MSKLPNMWIPGTIGARGRTDFKDEYVFAYFARRHDTEKLYIPAERILATIADFDARVSDGTGVMDLLDALDAIVRDDGIAK